MGISTEVDYVSVPMRLGLLGPSGRDAEPLQRAARLLLEDLAVERVVYLGVDGALDRVVEEWAEELVGDDPSEAAVWARATRTCLVAKPRQIDAFIDAERSRRRLRMLESLPDAETRVVEMLGGVVTLMIYDKAFLNEEDMLPARLLLFGKSEKPIIRQVGQRWFLSPGYLSDAGVMTLEDRDEGVDLGVYDAAGNELRHERLSTSRGVKLKVGSAGV